MQKSLYDGAINLTATQYSEVKRLLGETELEDTLRGIVSSGAYQEWTDELKSLVIKETHAQFVLVANANLILNDPKLLKQVVDSGLASAEQLTGQLIPRPSLESYQR